MSVIYMAIKIIGIIYPVKGWKTMVLRIPHRDAAAEVKVMKRTKAETAETRKRIVKVAAQEFRRNGISGTGVADIMSAAGLTHGGFYRHFESKDHLLAEACEASMKALVQSAADAAAGGHRAFLKHLEEFLSAENRDDSLGGCPLVAMGNELARADKATRHVASDGFKQLVAIIAKQEFVKDTRSAKAYAVFTLSAMIGAVTMSRIMDDRKLSDLILEATKDCLANLQPKPQ